MPGQSLRIAMVLCSRNQQVLAVNRAAERILDATAQAVIGERKGSVDHMNITVNALTALTQGPQLYRLRKCFAAVQFDQTAKGRIVFLPQGTDLSVVGSSHLSGCLEVLCRRQSYHMFEADLWGPWVAPIESKSRDRRPVAPPPAAMTLGASA